MKKSWQVKIYRMLNNKKVQIDHKWSDTWRLEAQHKIDIRKCLSESRLIEYLAIDIPTYNWHDTSSPDSGLFTNDSGLINLSTLSN